MPNTEKMQITRLALEEVIEEFASDYGIPKLAAVIAFQDQTSRMMEMADPEALERLLHYTLFRVKNEITEDKFYELHMEIQNNFHTSEYYRPSKDRQN